MSHLFDPERRSRLDAPERADWQKPDEVVRALALEPDMTVVDIGAGTGYFALRIARQLQGGGRLYAVDIQAAMLESLAARIHDEGARNVIPVYGRPSFIPLPAAEADLIFIANVAHEFQDLDASIAECARVLKPRGRLTVIDWKPEPTPVGPPADHRLRPERLDAASDQAGLRRVTALQLLPYQYCLTYAGPAR